MKKKLKKGFTLIELLVVISIIGVLVSLALVSFGSSQKQSRDTQRKSDLAQYRNALSNYAAAHGGFFISRNNRVAINSGFVCDGVLSPNFIADCPSDSGDFTYYYRSDGTGGGTATATTYVIWVELESGGFWEVCSDGRAGLLEASPAEGETDDDGACDVGS